jgi:hypothetical protein
VTSYGLVSSTSSTTSDQLWFGEKHILHTGEQLWFGEQHILHIRGGGVGEVSSVSVAPAQANLLEFPITEKTIRLKSHETVPLI